MAKHIANGVEAIEYQADDRHAPNLEKTCGQAAKDCLSLACLSLSLQSQETMQAFTEALS